MRRTALERESRVKQKLGEERTLREQEQEKRVIASTSAQSDVQLSDAIAMMQQIGQQLQASVVGKMDQMESSVTCKVDALQNKVEH